MGISRLSGLEIFLPVFLLFVPYGFAKAELAPLFPLCHRFDTDILNTNGIIVVCEVAGFLMQEIPALIGNFFSWRTATQMDLVRKEVDTLQTIKKYLLQQMFV